MSVKSRVSTTPNSVVGDTEIQYQWHRSLRIGEISKLNKSPSAVPLKPEKKTVSAAPRSPQIAGTAGSGCHAHEPSGSIVCTSQAWQSDVGATEARRYRRRNRKKNRYPPPPGPRKLPGPPEAGPHRSPAVSAPKPEKKTVSTAPRSPQIAGTAGSGCHAREPPGASVCTSQTCRPDVVTTETRWYRRQNRKKNRYPPPPGDKRYPKANSMSPPC